MTLLLQQAPDLWVSQFADRGISLESQKGIFSIRRVSGKGILSSASAISISKARTFASVQKAIGAVTTDYDTRIRHFCDVGNLDKAMDLLPMSPKSELELMTYCMVLQLSAERKSLNAGRKAHSVLISSGVEISGILGAKLVFMYVSCGDLKHARKVFDVVTNEKVFLWNLMMNEYTKVGDFEEGVGLFNKMRALNVDMNSHTFTSVLKLLGGLRSEDGGEAVHGCAVKMGLSSYNNNVANALITFYFKVGRLESACKVFDEMSERDVVSWNAMISGCVLNGVPEKAIRLFRQMLETGIEADSATLINVLVACSDSASFLLGRAAHSHVVKSGCKETMMSNALLDMYSKSGDLVSAARIFDSMGTKNVMAWTSMMAGYSRKGLSDKAIELFYRTESGGLKPDVHVITTVLHACASEGSLNNGRGLHEYIRKHGLESSLSIGNTLIVMYAKCGSMTEARAIFDKLDRKTKDVVSWNALIAGYAKNCMYEDVMDMLLEMQREGWRPDEFTLPCVLRSCASLATFENGRQVHGYALRNGLASNQHVANALIDMYVKCGSLVLARSVFDALAAKNLVSWTVMVAGYGIYGQGRQAVDMFSQMRRNGMEPDGDSFMAILSACSHSNLVEEGLRFFNIMRHSCKVEPELNHYRCVVQMLSRAGKLTEAYEFIRNMPVEADAEIWRELLCGCRVHHDVSLAEEVAEEVFRLEPENTENYMLLAKVYEEAERWEEARKLMEQIERRRGLRRKSSGCSWIEVRGKVEILTSENDDDGHSQRTKIHRLLTELRILMKEQTKSSKTKYMLLNAEELEKEAAVCGHSEQLAMGYGILNLPPASTIRVVKNLKVCGHCHEMAKFMSKMTKREIILRDSNRFHHFKDGHCSCRG